MLRSGGPLMTVNLKRDGNLSCLFFTVDEIIREVCVSKDLLVRVDQEKPEEEQEDEEESEEVRFV